HNGNSGWVGGRRRRVGRRAEKLLLLVRTGRGGGFLHGLSTGRAQPIRPAAAAPWTNNGAAGERRHPGPKAAEPPPTEGGGSARFGDGGEVAKRAGRALRVTGVPGRVRRLSGDRETRRGGSREV